MLRTFCHAFSACLTFLFVYHGNTVDNMYSIKTTGFYTGAIAKTSVGAGFFSAVLHKSSHFTVLYTGVIVAFSGFFAITGTFYKSCHTNVFSCFLPHNRCNLCRCCRSTYGTGIYRRFSLCNGCCQSVTSRKSAASAVIAGQLFPYLYFSFIYFYCKFLSGNSQKKSDEKPYAAYQSCRNDNSCYHSSHLLNNS
ncbi:unknown [Lachnospiraceae bacterium CAG:364]|nr:unknown [Lachnospiraceae bacterium CAG:364]